MSPEQLVSILGALTALVVAVGGLLIQVGKLRAAVDGVLHELVDARTTAAEKEGELRGRDFVAPGPAPPEDPEIRERC